MKFAESLPRLSILIIDALKNDLKINYIPTQSYINFQDIPDDVKKIVQNKDKEPGNVALFTDMLWSIYSSPYNFVPENSIKIAYSMLESTKIPNKWVKILNNKFDAVVVPDKFYCDVYANSGVNIPIFVIPHPMYLDEFIKEPIKLTYKKPFTFGMSAAFNERKNYDILLRAFARKFGNNPNIILKLHGRAGAEYPKILSLIKNLKLKNVSLIAKDLTRQEYKDFLTSLDCFVLLSKGEGFSLTPREALALTIPTILTNNTAQKTICDSGYVRIVSSNLQEPAYYICFKEHIGLFFNCLIEDAANSLVDVYGNYAYYLAKAKKGRDWVKQYDYKVIGKKFLTLIKPKRILLGKTNKINEDTLITKSEKLYLKYCSLTGS